MTITLHIRPEVETELIRQAAESGLAIEIYAANLLEEAVNTSSTKAKAATQEKDVSERAAHASGRQSR
jgi:hypothetical protein